MQRKVNQLEVKNRIWFYRKSNDKISNLHNRRKCGWKCSRKTLDEMQWMPSFTEKLCSYRDLTTVRLLGPEMNYIWVLKMKSNEIKAEKLKCGITAENSFRFFCLRDCVECGRACVGVSVRVYVCEWWSSQLQWCTLCRLYHFLAVALSI